MFTRMEVAEEMVGAPADFIGIINVTKLTRCIHCFFLTVLTLHS